MYSTSPSTLDSTSSFKSSTSCTIVSYYYYKRRPLTFDSRSLEPKSTEGKSCHFQGGILRSELLSSTSKTSGNGPVSILARSFVRFGLFIKSLRNGHKSKVMKNTKKFIFNKRFSNNENLNTGLWTFPLLLVISINTISFIVRNTLVGRGLQTTKFSCFY